MAKILPGIAVNKISGTIAGTTFQNWRGILVARSKPTPTNVMTPRQTVIRSIMSLLSRAWRDELNQGLRKAWNQRAKNYPWLDVFGRELRMSGENLYIKQNLVLLDHSLARQDTPVPDVVPDELVEVSADLGDISNGTLSLRIPSIDAGEITAQNPFIDIFVAGGFLSYDDSDLPTEINIESQCLPPGRKHQKSDFRHCFYFPASELVALPAGQHIRVSIPAGTTRNIVVSIRRYNKYGNFSAPRIFEAVSNNPLA